MIKVTYTERIGGQIFCDGCLLSTSAKKMVLRRTLRLEAKAGNYIRRTMQLCRECRIKMIHELEKTV